MAILVVIVTPFFTNYVDWTKRVTDRRSLELTNDAINRGMFSYANNPVYTAGTDGVVGDTSNSTAQNSAVINFLIGSPPTGNGPSSTIPNDKFMKKMTNATGANYVSVGQGSSFHFYDFNRDGIVLGTYSVPHS